MFFEVLTCSRNNSFNFLFMIFNNNTYMNKNSKKNNYFGIESFRNNPLSENLKVEICKYLLICPNIKPEDTKMFANNYITEESGIKLLRRLKKEVNELSKEQISNYILGLGTMFRWSRNNGFLTIKEIEEICSFSNADIREYYCQLEITIQRVNTKSSKLFLSYLEHYHQLLDEKSINWVLDKYLELEKQS